jgi:hypothetical protein
MPGNLTQILPTTVLPQTLCTAFQEMRAYEYLQSTYNDGTIQRGQLVQTSRRTFHLSKRLDAATLATLYAFWVAQGVTAFFFYNPWEVLAGQQIGSNYDPTFVNLQGLLTVVFRGNWSQATDVCRTNVQSLQLVEVA